MSILDKINYCLKDSKTIKKEKKMKNLKAILILALAATMLLLVACGETPQNPPQCSVHFDNNNDGKCDECEAIMEKQPCDECVDEDEDGECDVCGEEIESDVCEECVDEDEDGECDICGSDVTPDVQELVLIENNKANFNIVYQSGLPGSAIGEIDRLINQLKQLGVQINDKVKDDNAQKIQDCEVFIGSISTRGEEYTRDMHIYGAKGYAIELMGNKLSIIAGDTAKLPDVIAMFKTDILGISSSTKRLGTVKVTSDQNVIEIQDDYRTKQITLCGEDIRDYTIAADKEKQKEYSAARDLQDFLYTKTGYWLEIVPHEEADKSITVKLADKTGGPGYDATFEEGKMSFVCEYSTVLSDKITAFFNLKISKGQQTGVAEISEKDNIVAENVRDVFYEDFGANGNDKLDDSDAIRKCHNFANEGGHVVCAKPGATYYINEISETITVKTNVNWSTAKFIIDDRKILPSSPNRSVWIFTLPSAGTFAPSGLNDWKNTVNQSGGLDAATFNKIPLEFGQNALVKFTNANHKNYIRYGVNQNEGSYQTEVVLVDKDGNVDPTTPLMFDYEQITGISVYYVDVEPITIEGGIFITYPFITDTPQAYQAYARGIQCSRSNVTFKGVKHRLENEGEYDQRNHNNTKDYGCPYSGFYATNLCNNVRYENCIASAHITYTGSNGAGMGTYDISPANATNVVYKGCYQEEDNFFEKSNQPRWGVMGSGGCKNVTFEDSKLTRFDAHNGVHNVFLIRSELKMIRIDGTGTFYMEDCVMHSNTFVGLREDYGGFWEGNIIVKDTTIYTDKATTNLLTNTWYNHNFGYPASFPTNIIIDGLEIYKDTQKTPYTGNVNLFDSGLLNGATNSVPEYFKLGSETYEDGSEVLVANKNRIPSPERIIIKNCNVDIVIPSATDYPWFTSTVFSINEDTGCTHHIDTDLDLICDYCQEEAEPCTEHSDLNHDGRCTYCDQKVDIPCTAHEDKDRTGKCDICNADFSCSQHADSNTDHLCDNCKAPLCHGEHFDLKTAYSTKNCRCDVCDQKLPCVDQNGDKKCDTCEAKVS